MPKGSGVGYPGGKCSGGAVGGVVVGVAVHDDDDCGDRRVAAVW